MTIDFFKVIFLHSSYKIKKNIIHTLARLIIINKTEKQVDFVAYFLDNPDIFSFFVEELFAQQIDHPDEKIDELLTAIYHLIVAGYNDYEKIQNIKNPILQMLLDTGFYDQMNDLEMDLATEDSKILYTTICTNVNDFKKELEDEF